MPDPQQDSPATTPAASPRPRHPRGLYTLFFTEMWERFSYYGMRALLVLFMVDSVRRDGFGMTDEVATAVYGLYTAAAYLVALPGGWVADRILGAQRSVLLGGIIIALGHFTLAIPAVESFYIGLILVVAGTGLLKPNVSAIVGQLYPEGGARRDAGFTIFYMGINLGAFIGPLICSWLGEHYNWHYGFAAAGVGMLLGLIQYSYSCRHLGEAGRHPGHTEGVRTRDKVVVAGLAAVVVGLIAVIGSGVVRIGSPLLLPDDVKDFRALATAVRTGDDTVSTKIRDSLTGETSALLAESDAASELEPELQMALVSEINALMREGGLATVADTIPAAETNEADEPTETEADAQRQALLAANRAALDTAYPEAIPVRPTINPLAFAQSTKTVIVVVAAVYFLCVFLFFGLTPIEKKRVGVIVALFIGAAMFWSGFEQAGSSLNLFADRYTERTLPETLFGGFQIPAGWFQSLNPFYIITLAPVMAAVWVALARRNLDPSLPVKFGLGLVLLGAGFLVMAAAAKIVVGGDQAWPTWLITTYLLHSVGELCLSPVGLSSVTKLSPPRLVGQMMGTWFLAASLGNLIAGLLAGEFHADAVGEMPGLYLRIVLTTVGAGIVFFIFAKPIKSLMAGVK
jgi:POT family proton-dependent oligopeptide transporter